MSRPAPAPQVPALPSAAIRLAVREQDWAQATHLLERHGAALREALREAPPASAREAWMDLLAAQRALEAELEAARDAAAAALRQLQRQRSGALAYEALA